VEKQFRKLENRLEADYATLHAENKELVERQRQDEWTIHSLMAHMEMMEARMALVSAHVAAMAPPLQVDLMREEDCQGHSGPILITTPNERLCTVRLSLYQAID